MSIINRVFQKKEGEPLIGYDAGPKGLAGINYLSNNKNQLLIGLFINQQKGYLDKKETEKKINSFGLDWVFEYDFSSLMHNQISSHGIFYRKFIEEEIRQVIRPLIIKSKINQEKIHKEFYSFLNISDYNKKNLKLINQVELEILRYFILKFFGTIEQQEILTNWFSENNKIRKCKICGQQFRTVNIPDWIYVCVYKYKDCCFNCNIVQKNNKKIVIRNIKKFVEACGFIPHSGYSFLNKEFTYRINGNWKSIIECYSKVGHPSHTNQLFGSWFQALYDAKLIESIVTPRGVKCLSKDGHVCNSLAEKQIDDWLFDNNIEHKKEPMYPKHLKLNPKGRKRADWLVNDIYVEYFGLIGSQQYDLNLLEKLQLVDELNLKLVEIYPKDLNNLNGKLNSLLQQ